MDGIAILTDLYIDIKWQHIETNKCLAILLILKCIILFPGAEKAIDGNTDPKIDRGFCAHMDAKSGSPGHWSVDLGQDHVIINVTLFNRLESKTQARMEQMHVYVSNRTDFYKDRVLCAKHDPAVASGGSITLTCQPGPLVGRYVIMNLLVLVFV